MRKELSWLEGFINSLNCQHSCFLGAGSELPVPTWFNLQPASWFMSRNKSSRLNLTYLTVSILIAPFKYPQHNHLVRRFAFFFLLFSFGCDFSLLAHTISFRVRCISCNFFFFFFFTTSVLCIMYRIIPPLPPPPPLYFFLGIIIILLSFYLTSGLGRVWFFDLWFSLMIFFFFFLLARIIWKESDIKWVVLGVLSWKID
jgi:hypothetical protein